MCGILGRIPVGDPQKFARGLQNLAHRGPDGEGIWRDEGAIELGHRRLAVVQTDEAGSQPMQYQHLVLTGNAEIYNHADLRKILSRKGYAFKSGSDMEVLLAAYLHWGEKCLDHFLGMWAFGIWDKRKKELFLARDRFGQKPLYYHQRGERLAFASEMRALFPLMNEVRPADNILDLLAKPEGFESGEDCLVAGIRRFPAGHWARFRAGNWELRRWWHTRDHLQRVEASPEEIEERFWALLADAVAIRLRTDVPVGSLLSGGIDSGAVTLLARRALHAGGRVLQSVSMAFPGAEIDESASVRLLQERCSLDLRIVQADPVKALNEMESQAMLFGEIHDTPIAPMIQAYQALGRKVSLDGHGADELLAGYGQGLLWALKDAAWNLKAARGILDAYRGYYPDSGAFSAPNANWLTWLRYQMPIAVEPEFGSLAKEIGWHNAYLYRVYHEDVFPRMLRNYDRFGMMAGVESRMPFADHRLVCFALSLPYSYKIRDGFGKYILRKTASQYLDLPKSIVWQQKKVAFSAPVADWLRGPWREWAQDMLQDQAFRQSALLDASMAQSQFEDILAEKPGAYFRALSLWKTFATYLWEKTLNS